MVWIRTGTHMWVIKRGEYPFVTVSRGYGSDDDWYVTLVRDSLLHYDNEITLRVFTQEKEKNAIRFAIKWMRSHPNG